SIENQLTMLQDELTKLKQSPVEETRKEYLKHYEKIGSKYYYIEANQKINWFAAAHKCHELGGHLLSLQNQQEYSAVTPKLNGSSYWIDINDLGYKGFYLSHTTGKTSPYFNWHKGEPNHAGNVENCVVLEKRKTSDAILMNDDKCLEFRLFVCEFNEHK
ncbi:hypothetical protein KR093_002143, partial [Drosophila rubida]